MKRILFFTICAVALCACNNAKDEIPGLKDFIKDDFKIGVAVSPFTLQGESGEMVKKHFNTMTAENAMKPASIIQQGNDFFPSAAEANVKVRATRLKGSNLLSNSANDADYSGVIKGFNRSSDSAPSGVSTVAKDPSDWFSSGGNL